MDLDSILKRTVV